MIILDSIILGLVYSTTLLAILYAFKIRTKYYTRYGLRKTIINLLLASYTLIVILYCVYVIKDMISVFI